MQISRFFIIVLFGCLSAVAGAGEAAPSVTLAWDPNPETDILGYRLYYGTASHAYSKIFDLGNITTTTVSGLATGTKYYFAVTAYDQDALESLPSDEITFETAAEPVQAAPLATISKLQFTEDGSAQIQVDGFNIASLVPTVIDVEVSNDLITWQVLARLSPPFEAVNVTDPDSKTAPQRFYRLVPR